MTRVLFVGQQPETVDFSDPALPPGFNAEKINVGIAIGVAKITEQGWQADLCMIPPDETAGPMLEKQLASAIGHRPLQKRLLRKLRRRQAGSDKWHGAGMLRPL